MKTINAIYAVLVSTALICLLLLLFEPPHAHTAEAAEKIKPRVDYFKQLASTTTTSTTTTTTTTEAKPVIPTTTTFPYRQDEAWVVELITSFFPENPNLWIAIARCESGLNPNAYNPEGASGLFQVMMPLHKDMVLSGENIFDPVVNVRIARSLSRNGTSTTHWDASKGCWN